MILIVSIVLTMMINMKYNTNNDNTDINTHASIITDNDHVMKLLDLKSSTLFCDLMTQKQFPLVSFCVPSRRGKKLNQICATGDLVRQMLCVQRKPSILEADG